MVAISMAHFLCHSGDMSTPIKLIAGLGNPGREYQQTRHNAGFLFVDRIAEAYGLGFRGESRFKGELARLQDGCQDCRLLKPTTFMNRSGQAVAAVAGFYRIEPAQILVAHDDLDLPAGTVRLKRGGGHGGHNGLRDIIQQLGSQDFIRVRIGIGHPGDRDAVTPYVLSRPGRADEAAMNDAIGVALDILPTLLRGELEKAMQTLHSN